VSVAGLDQQIKQLLTEAGFNPQIDSLKECVRGGNNRTYQLKTPDGCFALKQYFRRADDKRDRLASEFAFLTYAQQVAPHAVPKSYCQNITTGLALYEFIEGNAMKAHELQASDMMQASQFFCALNQPKHKLQANALPIASEACFNIQTHLDVVSARIVELNKMTPETAEDQLARVLIAKLNEDWQKILADIHQQTQLDLEYLLPAEERCISPSDFGFHNALRRPDGRICFLDFEYAGWDDPAKMIGDFFSQLAVPVDAKYFNLFVETAMQPFVMNEQLMKRIELLRMVYQVKWCCIALNIFLPVHLARRQFANPELDVVALKKTQLCKAELLMNNWKANYGIC